MENIKEPNSLETKYTRTWFIERARNAFTQINKGVWDFSDSLLLYMPSGEETYTNIQNVDTLYHRLVTAPEHEYLKHIASDVVQELPDDFVFIDLGPGTEHKEQFIFDACKEQGKSFTYIPVDISDFYLNLAKRYAEGQSISTKSTKAAFEELPLLLGDATKPRFVSLGLTFSNYDPQQALTLLKAIAQSGGYIFINTQTRDRIDMKEIRDIYGGAASSLCKDKLALLGLEIDTTVSRPYVDENNQVWCDVLALNDELRSKGVVVGDKILLFQSLRYSKSDLEKELKSSASEYTLFDTGETFIAALLKT